MKLYTALPSTYVAVNQLSVVALLARIAALCYGQLIPSTLKPDSVSLVPRPSVRAGTHCMRMRNIPGFLWTSPCT